MFRVKLCSRSILTTFVAGLSAIAAVAQPAPPPTLNGIGLQPASQPGQPVEVGWYQLATPLKEQLIKAAYMGVGVELPTDTLRAQLKLPEGSGLVVSYVDEHGPSNGMLQKHDLLQKLNDQILINVEQFQALVRMHKPGEAIQIGVIREAHNMTVALKLAEKEVSPLTNGMVLNGENNIYTSRLTQTSALGLDTRHWLVKPTLGLPLADPTSQPAEVADWYSGMAAPGKGGDGKAGILVRLANRLTEPVRIDDRAAVLRRLTLDITGAVPSAEEIQAFVTDKSPDAYEKIVNKLMTNAPATLTVPSALDSHDLQVPLLNPPKK